MIWKDINGFDGLYQVNESGEVKSVERTVIRNNGRPLKIRERILAAFKDTNGYYMVTLNKNGTRKHVSVHRLVCMAFNGDPNGLPQVNHKDGNRLNNHYSNLEWCSASHNNAHSYAIGLACNKGENNPYSKLTETDILEIRALIEKGYIQREVAKMYNVSATNITDIKKRKIWAHV